MSIVRNITRAIRMTLVLWVLTAVIYPLFIFLVGHVPLLHDKAEGSIVYNLQGQPIGSVLIGQAFSSERYFISRPSTVEYSTGEDAAPTGISGASNLAPSNRELLKRVELLGQQLEDVGIQPIADLVYASGSGLDPHITLDSAFVQLERVAKARNLPTNEIEPFITEYMQGRFLGIFGEPRVNVLKLNYALDVLQAPRE